MMWMGRYFERRPRFATVVILVALLLCAIFMPGMAMFALVGCIAIAAVTMRPTPKLGVSLLCPATPKGRGITVALPRSTGPPVLVPLRT